MVTTIPGRWFAILWAASFAVIASMILHAHEHVAVRSPAALAVLGGILVTAGARFALRDGGTRARCVARDLAEQVGLFATIALLGTLASYPEAASSTGFADPYLAAVDRRLGFDWVAWYRMVAAHPSLQLAGRLAYQSIYVSPTILLVHYANAGRQAQARSFLMAFWIAILATLLLFPCLAAAGPLAYLWHGPVPYMPTTALYQAGEIAALRSHASETIDMSALKGLVSAPSFHATSAVLFAAYAWRERTIRWPVLALNAAMLIATPVEGTHYLADIILGGIVAAIAIPLAKEVARLQAQWPRPASRADIPARQG